MGKSRRTPNVANPLVAPLITGLSRSCLSDPGLYGREGIVRGDWTKIFHDTELDKVITRMLRIDQIERTRVATSLDAG